MNDNDVTRESEYVLRRLSDAFPVGPPEAGPVLWLVAVGLILMLGIAYVVWSYVRESRTIGWGWAAPLALLRSTVLVILAGAFLLPAIQTWESTEKNSRVLVLLDVSPSITEISDEIASGSSSPKTRLDKIIDYLSDDEASFLAKILEKNPIYFYRFGARLDEDSFGITTPERLNLTADDWAAWANYDFKPWLLRNLSESAKQAVKAMPAWDGDNPGTAEWALDWAKYPQAEIVPSDLEPDDEQALKDSIEKLDTRVELARAIVRGTNVPGSIKSLIDREASNMVQGVIVFTDGRSNLGSSTAYSELKERATREKIPVFTVGVGESRENVSITITDVQAPDRASPDEQFKIAVEADGTGLANEEVEVRLGLYLPGRDPKEDAPDHELIEPLEFVPGEPPHGMVEFVIDPEKLPELLTEPSEKLGSSRELKQGSWNAVARIARDRRETFPDQEHVSPPRSFEVLDKPLRVLLFASAATREYQTLRTMFVREVAQNRAELSICLQSEGGREGTAVQDVPAERLLTRFPYRLDTTDKPTDKPEDKFYNLNEYDLIIAFDPDWSELTEDQISNLQTWVDNLGGGLIYVAGPVHTFQLARAGEDGRLRPLLDILPVIPEDIILVKTRPVPRTPRRLLLKPSPDFDVLKLDETDPDDPTAGWEPFFSGRKRYSPDPDPRKNAMPERGFYAYYPVKDTKPGATTLAEFQDLTDRGDVEARPWLVTTQPARGRTAFLASGELWRLRPHSVDYYERIWVKLSRYLSANRDVRASRGRVLISKEFNSGSPVRMQVRLLDPSGRPYPEDQLNARFTIRRLDALGERALEERDGASQPVADLGPYELKPRVSGSGFDGYYSGQVLADPRLMPPGDFRYQVIVEVPDSPGDTITGEFMIKQSDPELDNPRPDFAALYNMVSTVEEVKGRVSNEEVLEGLQALPSEGGVARLSFRLNQPDQLSLIPECLESKSQTLRSRGPVDDLWDKPLKIETELFGKPINLSLVEFESSLFTGSSRTYSISFLLLLIVLLLSMEWATRKLLRLA